MIAMWVLRKFTWKSLLRNPARSVVTVIGILLSMALFTAVTEGAYSGLQFLKRSVIADEGACHGFYEDMTAEQMGQLRSDGEIAATAAWQEVGWAEIGSQNPDKPYLHIVSAEETLPELLAIHLTEGRMPEKEGELLLPEHLATNGGVYIPIGESLTLRLENTDAEEQKTYTVVGFYKRFSYTVEPYESAGYTALTAGGNGTGRYTVFFTVKHPGAFYSYMEEHAVTPGWKAHDDLLELSGSFRNSVLTRLLYSLAGVLLFLIAFGSISLIYNAFSISVSERTRQFGILKSVGATRRQIRGTVLWEALVLCGVAIPLGLFVGCAGIGVTLYLLRDSFSSIIETGGAVQMELVLHPGALLIAAGICLLTTLLSAFLPAGRAMRVSAIDSIRQTNDVRLKKRDVRSFPLTRKLFGLEGMLAAKNFRRSRKRYRSVVFSLFLSVLLFIGASSFCAYLTDSVATYSTDSGVDLSYSPEHTKDVDPDALLAELCKAESVTKGAYVTEVGNFLHVEAEALSKEGQGPWSPEDGIFTQIMFLEDDTFRELCAENGLKEADYFREEAPMALAWNRAVYYVEEGTGASMHQYSCLNAGALPVTGQIIELEEREGYQRQGIAEMRDGVLCYPYYPTDYLVDYWSDEGATLDPNRAVWFPAEEVEKTCDITVGATLKELPFYLPAGNNFSIVYPYSMQEAVLGSLYNTEMNALYYYFQASQHEKAAADMAAILREQGLNNSVYDIAASRMSQRALVTVMNVFSYGFIILISLIAMANVFNTVSTNVSLRRREIAMLRSVGLTRGGFRRMMNYECLIYGLRGLMYGLPASVLLTYLIFRITGAAMEMKFYIPWYSVAIAVASVFLVVFATMLYATRRVRRDNPIDALRTENL